MSDEMQRKIFSERLNHYMYLNNKMQVDLMNDLDINKSTISSWCNGSKMPRMGSIQMLADYFGINKSDLIEDKELDAYYIDKETREMAQELSTNSDMKMLFDMARHTSPDTLRAYVQMMKILKDKEDNN